MTPELMHPETRRAHLILHGQTLSDEWTARCKLRAEGRKLWAEGHKLRAEGHKLWAEAGKLWAEAGKLWAEAGKLWAEGNKLYAEADKLWDAAVLAEFGPACTIEWEGDDCILGVGERYERIT